MVYVTYVEGGDAYAVRNVMPLLLLVVLAAVSLYRGGGSWTGAGWCWPLGTVGFAIPALGLSLYLHHAYAAGTHGLFEDAIYPQEVFRYLPAYTLFAGAIGFAIGWIAGRNI
jgi:hypothetical protein